MADPFLAISAIANDDFMNERLRACATQQVQLQTVSIASNLDALTWVYVNRYVWASSPSWGEKWKYALDSHPAADPPYQPGKDEAVITDGDILSTVQSLVGLNVG